MLFRSSSLARAVIALHALVDNKAANGRAELEERKGESKAEDNQMKKGGKADIKLSKEKGKDLDAKPSKEDKS